MATAHNLREGIASGERGHDPQDIVVYLPDYHAFSKIMYDWLCKMPSSPRVNYLRVQKEMLETIKKVQNLLETTSEKSKRFQSIADFFGLRQICLELAFLIFKGKDHKEKDHDKIDPEEIESYVNDSIYLIISEIRKQIEKSVSNRDLKRKFAILRLGRAVSAAKKIIESAEQPEGSMKNEYKNISPEELLLVVAEKIGIPSAERKGVSHQLLTAFKKAKLKMQRDGDAWRPRWLERPDSLKALTAPLFLKKVWADLFDKEGQIIDEERIRAYDSKLIQVVQQYISKRQERNQDLGDAKGVLLTNKGWNGPDRIRKPKSRPSAIKREAS